MFISLSGGLYHRLDCQAVSVSLSLFLARHIEVVHEIEFANCVNTDISVSFIF